MDFDSSTTHLIVAGFSLVLFPLQILQYTRTPFYKPLPYSRLFLLKLFLCALLSISHGLIILDSVIEHRHENLLEHIFLTCCFASFIVIHLLRARAGEVTSAWQHATATAFLVAGGRDFYLFIKDLVHGNALSSYQQLYIAYYCLQIIYFLSLFKSDPRSPQDYEGLSPEENCSFFSSMIYWWLNPIILKGFKKDLEMDDLFELQKRVRSEYVTRAWEAKWEPKLADYKRKSHEYQAGTRSRTVSTPSLIFTYLSLVPMEFASAAFVKLIYDSVGFGMPYLMRKLLDYVAHSNPDVWYGVGCAVLMFAVSQARTLLLNFFYFIQRQMDLKLQVAFTAAIYKKTLSLSNSARQQRTIGEIVNLMAIDIDYMITANQQCQLLWSAPYTIILSLCYLYFLLGTAAIPGFLVMLLFFPLNLVTSRFQKKWQTDAMKLKDNRTKMINEVLNGIKVVKLYAWEIPMEDQIKALREKEVRCITKIAIMRNLMDVFDTICPILVALVCFATYVLTSDKDLTPQIAFVSLSLLNQISDRIVVTAYVWNWMLLAYVSNKRLKSFLVADELDPEMIEQPNDIKNDVQLDALDVTWQSEFETPTLSDVSYSIQQGKLIAVVGKVGCGKSSLLSSMLGEMEKLRGRIGISGRLGYVPQQPWIQNLSVRDNIIFGREFNEIWYNKVVHACALIPDLKILPQGDLTEIGEKGITLSGGQKARIALARAVYQNLDVYLLDDPLAAVDAHVARHIFEKVIGPNGLLSTKTRILVTHGLSHTKHVDEIVVMKDGRIAEIGTYLELIEKNGPFLEFINEYKKTPKKSPSSSDVSDVSSGDELSAETETVAQINLARISLESAISVEDESAKLLANTEGNDSTRLVQRERVESGWVDTAVYHAYIKACTYARALSFLLLIAAFLGVQTARNFWLSAWSEDSAKNATERVSTGLRLGVYGILGTLEATVFAFAMLAFVFATTTASRNLHNPMIHCLLRAKMAFFDTTPLGRILNRCAKDVDDIDYNIPYSSRYLVTNGLQILTILIIISSTTPLFMIVIPPLGVIYYISTKYYVPTARQVKRLQSVTRSPIFSHFSESIQGATSIRAFRRVEEFRTKSGENVDRYLRCRYGNMMAIRWITVRLETIGNLVVFFAAIFAVFSRHNGWLQSAGTTGLSITYALNITDVLNFFVRQIGNIESQIVAVERIVEYMKIDSEADWEGKPPPRGWPHRGVVELKRYSTRYRPGLDLVLKNISFVANPQEKIGIVGRTGAGKSSFALALFRMIEAAKGKIYIDGILTSDLGLHDLRSRITIIPQDPVLFSGTFRFNIDPFNHYTDSELWKALHLAHLSDLVSSFPQNLEYNLSEGGENISVGQRQLVCLARAVLRKSKILLLDEATAAVDVTTDALIQATIREQFADCTIFTIAHRLNTIMDYDRILVLDQGEVAEFASPAELLANPESIFAKMVADANAQQH